MSGAPKKSSQQQQQHPGQQIRQAPSHRSYSAAASGQESGHYPPRISYQQIPPRQHSPAPHDLGKGQQQPQLAHTPPQTVTAAPQQQGAGVVPGGQPPMMHHYQQHRPSQPYYHHQPHQQRQHRPSGMSMQRPVTPQSQQMYSTSPATQVMQQPPHPQYQQQAIYIPQQTMNNPGIYNISTEDGYSMYMTSNSGPTHTVWTASNYQPGVRQAYPQPVAQQAGGQYIAPSTPPYYTPSQPGPNPEFLYSAGHYYQPPQQQQMAPPVQYRQQQQTYSTQPVQQRTYEKPPPREKKLIRIIDPNKGVDVTDEIMKSSSNSSVTTSSTANITPPLSGRSSASGTPPQQISQSATPPPSQQQIQGNSIAAQFAAQVAATLGPATESDSRTNIAKPVASVPEPVSAVVEQPQAVPAETESKQDAPDATAEPGDSVPEIKVAPESEPETAEQTVESKDTPQPPPASSRNDENGGDEVADTATSAKEDLQETVTEKNVTESQAKENAEKEAEQKTVTEDVKSTDENVTENTTEKQEAVEEGKETVVETPAESSPVVNDNGPKKEETKENKTEEKEETKNVSKPEETQPEITITDTTVKEKKKTTKQKMKEYNKKGTEDADPMEAFKDKDESTNETQPEEDATKNEDEMENMKENTEVAEIPKEVNNSEKTEEEKRNEENEKKSKEEESIDNSEVRRDPKDNKIELKYKYREDQWSPINTEGKRQYDREFLLQFQFEANCVEKPEGLPKIADVILDSVKQPTRFDPKQLAPGGMGGGKMDFLPSYIGGGSTKNKPGGYIQTGRGPPRRQNQKEVRKIISSASLGTDIKLRTADNAWKPQPKKGVEVKTDSDPEKAKTDDLYKKVTGILNKLTPQKFQTLTQQVLDLPIDTEDRLKGVIDLVFEKAISEPGFSVAYANMCRCLMSMKVPTGDGKGNVNFRKLLLNKCQKEFEKDKEDDDEMEAKKKAMEDAETKEEKDKRKEEYDSYETKMRRRSLGNIRFIGELFKLKMLTEPIMHDCVVKLLKAHDHESLECLCRLLSTIGKDLDHEKAKPRVDQYFAQMDRIVKSKKYSARVRFMLQDVIELRGNNWVPRRDENNPKTIEQIHKEAKLEQEQQQLLLQQQPPPQSNKRVRGRGDRGQGQADDGWSMVSSTRSRPSFDPNKFKVTKQTVDENIQLGPGGRPGGVFGGWGRGSSGGTGSKSQQEQQEARPTPTNRFQALASGETQVYDSSRRGSRELGRGRDNKGSRQLSGPRRSSSRESARDGRNREREEAIAIAKNLSSSQALAERGKDRARTPEPRATTPVPAEPKNVGNEMSEEAMEKKCKAILEEFMHLRDTREVQTCVAELRSPSMLYIFVRIAVEQSLERNESTRQACGTLMYDLIREGLMEKQQYIKGFAEILEFAEDIAIDIPKFWTYMGEFIAPLVQSGKIPMNILQDISRPLHGIGKAGLLTAEVLLVASKIIGEARIAELWHNSGLEWSSLLPAGGDVNEFLERKGLLFTAPNSSRTSSQTATEGMPISKIQGHLEHLLLRERASNDKIFDWIEANVVKDRRKDSDFIRALMTAVCQSAVSGEGSSCRCEINEVKNRAAVLQKYLDNDDKLELQALYALQALNYKLDSPPSLLRIFFDKLYDEDVISEEAFYAWEKSDDPNEQLGKGVALKSVTAFFTWLREADDDSAE
ncbi:eukaryotic translation initiation factor 4 gamma 3-like isoform X5 [Ptychodera flava]|uniref:eukaryotic translation initiation factor 4 gamma 3-like isoform X5 n=1 Tax=Ptychodera flava TaxID=63121 RepID=UPI00396AA101